MGEKYELCGLGGRNSVEAGWFRETSKNFIRKGKILGKQLVTIHILIEIM